MVGGMSPYQHKKRRSTDPNSAAGGGAVRWARRFGAPNERYAATRAH